MRTLLDYTRRYIILAGLLVALIAVSSAFVLARSNDKPARYTVATDTLERTARFSGTVEPVREVELGFNTTGRVASVRVDVGERVATGTIMAELENDDLLASLREAYATLHAEEMRLQKLRAGSRPQTIAAETAQLRAADAQLTAATQQLEEQLNGSFTVVENAMERIADDYFTRVSTDPILLLRVGNEASELQETREEIYDMFRDWRRERKQDTPAPLATRVATVREHLTAVRDFLSDLSDAANAFNVSINDTDRSAIFSAWQSVDEAHRTLLSYEQTYQENLAAREAAAQTLARTKAGERSEDVAIQAAAVAAAQARIAKLEAELEKTRVRAPFAGIVTKRELDPGEQSSRAPYAFVIMSDERLVLEGDVSELAIAAVSPGATTTVSFDALGAGNTYSATVATVAPAETVIGNVPAYEVTLTLDEPVPGLRPGMTGEITARAPIAADVPVVPESALLEREGDRATVLIWQDGTARRARVQLGTRSPDGSIEIISGVRPGDEIVRNPRAS